MSDAWKSAYAAMHREGAADFPPAALRYVLDVTRHETLLGAGHAEATLSPAGLIAAFRKSARADFGPLLSEVLERWDLGTPAALGRAVNLLGRYGCLSLDAGDDPEAFATDPLPLSEKHP